MQRIDFQDIKTRVTIEQACAWLDIALKPSSDQLRGTCPVCNDGDPRALAITPAKQIWNCFCNHCRKQGKVGGDVIALVAFVRKVGMKEAAAELAQRFLTPVKQETKGAEKHTFDPAEYAAKLEYTHDMVQAMGLTPEHAKSARIGFCRKGVLAGRVAIPLTLETGAEHFMGYNPTMTPVFKLPKL